MLVWNTRGRPWVLAAGVLLHVGIDLIIERIFSYAMPVMSAAWIAPATAGQLPSTIKPATTQLRHDYVATSTSPPTSRTDQLLHT